MDHNELVVDIMDGNIGDHFWDAIDTVLWNGAYSIVGAAEAIDEDINEDYAYNYMMCQVGMEEDAINKCADEILEDWTKINKKFDLDRFNDELFELGKQIYEMLLGAVSVVDIMVTLAEYISERDDL